MSKDSINHAPDMGRLAPADAVRDAVHFPVAPVFASHDMPPGSHVGLDENGEAVVSEKSIGIVDPYLSKPVRKGERFWLMLYPNTISSLRHEWEHWAFPLTRVIDVSASQKWLRDLAARMEKPYDSLIAIGKAAIEKGSAWAGDDTDMDTLNEVKWEFVRHVANVIGTVPPSEEVYFSCSC